MGTKSSRPSVAKLKERAWSLLSQLIRRREAEKQGGGYLQCYTCGDIHPWNSAMHAGHAIPGRTGAVLLDEEIIRPQCAKCNLKAPFGRGGEYHIFAAKLIKENGMEWWDAKLVAAKQVKKWNRIELQEKIAAYRIALAEFL